MKSLKTLLKPWESRSIADLWAGTDESRRVDSSVSWPGPLDEPLAGSAPPETATTASSLSPSSAQPPAASDPHGEGSGAIDSAGLQPQSSSSGSQIVASQPLATGPEELHRGTESWTAERVQQLLDSELTLDLCLPDIRATAPTHLQIQNSHQRELLRFSNSIANTGANNLQVRRGTPLTDPDQIAYAESLGLDPSQLAITSQELLHPDGTIAAVIPDAALSEYHPEHKHFHIGETAEFALEVLKSAGDWDSITGRDVVKTTFCLIDVNQIQRVGSDPDHYDIIKSPAVDNVYNDCFADVQGIQAGWIDRYNHALPGQAVDITGLAAGIYRIVCTVNPSGWFLESDYTNNVGWTSFELSRDSNGNARLLEIPGGTGGIWFNNSSNGMG